MSTSLHCIIQTKTKDVHGTDVWVDTVKGAFDLWTSAARQFFDDVQGVASSNFPNGFIVNSSNEHDDMYMGDYGFCTLSGEDFLALDYTTDGVRSIKQDISANKVIVTFYLKPRADYDDDDWYDEDLSYKEFMAAVQKSITTILGCDKSQFRLVMGWA